MSDEDIIIEKIRKEVKGPEITMDDRGKAMLKILNHPDTDEQMKNAWGCLTKFYDTTKAMGSPMQEEAKRAAVFITKLRATYEVYGPNSDSSGQPVDQSSIGQKADDSVL